MQTLMVCTSCKTSYNVLAIPMTVTILGLAGLICGVGCGVLLTLEGEGK